MRQRLIRLALAGVLGAAIPGLASCTAGAPPTACIPELTVAPDAPRAGESIEVRSDIPCPGTSPAEGWTIRILPEGMPSTSGNAAPGTEATVVPDANGTFAITMTVPAGMPPGPARVTVSNYYDHVPCDDHGSCAEIGTSLVVRTP